MQNDPNKALEVLLRRADGGGSPPSAQPHLDADTVAAFAAGALPQSLRNDYISHLADCARCRVMLSAAATFEPIEVPTLVPARILAETPWWRNLPKVPAFTYASVLFILVFGGIIALLVLRSGESGVELSQVEEPTRSAPSDLSSAESKTESAQDRKSEETEATPVPVEKHANVKDRPVVAEKFEVMSAPPPVAAVAAAQSPAPDESASKEAREERPSSRMAAPAPKAAPMMVEPELNVRGKTFTKRDGVWIDSDYRGGTFKTVKRGTEDYEGLDAGIRSLANEVPGTLIVVWQGQAYRIQ